MVQTGTQSCFFCVLNNHCIPGTADVIAYSLWSLNIDSNLNHDSLFHLLVSESGWVKKQSSQNIWLLQGGSGMHGPSDLLGRNNSYSTYRPA